MIYIQFDPACVIQKHIEVNLHGLAVFNGNYDKKKEISFNKPECCFLHRQRYRNCSMPGNKFITKCFVTLWSVHTSKSISITNSLNSEKHVQSGNCKLIISISFRVIVVLSSDFLLGFVLSLHNFTHFAPKQTNKNK